MQFKSFISMLLLFSLGCHVQAQVRQFDISAGNNSIIRTIDSGRSLIYTEEFNTTTASFLLYHDGQTSAFSFQVPPGIQVRDVRIYDNSVAYFCGTYNGGSSAVVGMFSINGVFLGAMPIYYALINWTNDDMIKPTDLKRLDIFTTPTDSVCMAMVGDAIFDNTNPFPTTTVVSAHFNGAIWDIHSIVRKPSESRFTDIACLDDMIVVAASDTNGQGCFVKTFHPTHDFPAHPFTPQQLYGIVYGNAVGDVLITKLFGNTAVVAHYDVSSGVSTVFHRVAFNSISGHHAVPTDTWTTSPLSTMPYGNTWTMMELLSDGSNNNLLQHAQYPILPILSTYDWLVSFSLPVSISTTATAWQPSICKHHSLDWDAASSQPRTSGCAPKLTTYGTTWHPLCSQRFSLTLQYNTATKSTEKIVEYSNNISTFTHTVLPTIKNISVSTLCE